MTNVSYDIMYKGSIVSNVKTYAEAKKACETNGSGWTYKPVYTDYNPEQTPEYKKYCADRINKMRMRSGLA